MANWDFHRFIFAKFKWINFIDENPLKVFFFFENMWIISPNHFVSFAIHYFYTKINLSSCVSRNGLNNNFLNNYQTWALNSFLKCLLEVLHVSLLRRLTYSSSRSESFVSVICNCVYEGIGQPSIYQEAAYRCTSSSFAGIAVANYNVLGVVF